MSGLRGVVIGGGAVGSDFHVPRLLALAGCAEVTVVDVQEVQCERLRRRFADNPAVSVANVLPENDIDIAVVATPPRFHLPCFEQLKGRTGQVVIEKPLTRTLEEAQDLVALAGQWPVTTYVGLIRRSLTNFKLLKSWFHSGLFGDLKSVLVSEGLVFNWNAVSLGSFSRDLNGGGVLMDSGPHTLDQMLQVFETLTLKSAKLDALPVPGGRAIEANATIELRADGRYPVTVLLSRNRALSNTARFEFERATISLGLHSNAVEVTDRDGHGLQGLPIEEAMDVSYPELFDAYYRKFILKRDNSGISAEDSLPIQQLIDDVYASAQPMEAVF